jgi:hypothetical protein
MAKKTGTLKYVLLGIFAIVVFQTASVIIQRHTYTRGDSQMPTDIDLDTADAVHPLPEMYPVTKGTINIFSVPEPEAVGTNDINDAITLLRFNNGNLEYKEVRRSFVEQVSGGDLSFTPVFSKDVIAYSQTRRFVLFNVHDGSFHEYGVYSSIDDEILSFFPVDPEKNLFLFEIDTYPIENDPTRIRFFKLYKFDGGSANKISEFSTGRMRINNQPWALQSRTLILYNDTSRTLHAYDMNFKENSHPLVTIFNENAKKFRLIDQLYIHPTLPFAVLVDIPLHHRSNYIVWVIRWDKREPEIFPILGLDKEIFCSGFEFSPDGKLLLYRDQTANSSNPDYVIFPVDSSQPAFLGKPRHLGNLPRKPATAFTGAWIAEPQSFVVTDGDILYRWNLESAARP